jgi:hypothetical protein
MGLKLSASYAQTSGQGWSQTSATALWLASLQLNAQWAVHANLGASRLRPGGTNAGLLNLAASWSPDAHHQVFIEWLGNNRHAELGHAMRAAGGRWWLDKDQLGLDLSLSRDASPGLRPPACAAPGSCRSLAPPPASAR